MNRHIFRHILLVCLLLTLAGCDVIRGVAPFFLPNPSTPVPTNTPYPLPTPQPSTTINFKVTVPANTPAGSNINLFMPDLVGGAANKTFILTSMGGNVWVGSVSAPIGSLLRYRFQRITGTQTVGESRADGGAVVYRTAVVSGTMLVEETVATWSDTAFTGETGRITGVVRDASSNTGLPGIIVSAGGQQTVTGFDGEYVLWNMPANALASVSAFAPDGSFRASMNNALPPANSTAYMDFGLWAAKTVKVTFVVAPPADMPVGAAIQLVGNVLQLGDTFVINATGSTAHAERQPQFSQLADGRWAASLFLFEGTDLRYKYTLGSATINSELNADGSPVLRQFVLPGSDDIVIQDQVANWKSSLDAPVAFAVDVPANTPPTDPITLQFKIGGVWRDPVRMWHTQPAQWSFTLLNPLDYAGDSEYRFCRSFECSTADDAATFGANPAGYHFTPTLLPQSVQNRVGAWQWWVDLQPPALNLPTVLSRPGFQAGFELAPWHTPQATALPFTFDNLKGTNANWIRIPIIWDASSVNPPQISFDFARSPFRQDLLATIRAAKDRGYKVALYPMVRPSPNGPYGGDLNLYFDTAPKDSGWWDGWYREYARFLAYTADVAAFTGADAYYIGDAAVTRTLPGAPTTPADADARWRSLIAALKNEHYNVPVIFSLDLVGQSPVLSPAPSFLDAVDVIDIRFAAALSASPTASLEELKTNAAALIDTQLQPLSAQYNKPIIITAQYVSADGGAAQCVGLVTGSCQPISHLAPDQPDSVSYSLDLNEQQLAYEAILFAINDRPWLNGFFAYGYNPTVALRDKYYSPRSKPAEALLTAWFARTKVSASRPL